MNTNDFIADLAKNVMSGATIKGEFNGHTVTVKQVGAFSRWTVNGCKVKNTYRVARIIENPHQKYVGEMA